MKKQVNASYIIHLKCPACGNAKLYQRYLKPVDICSHCGVEWQKMNVADAAAWLVMLFVSFIAAPLATYFAMTTDWSLWWILLLSSSISIALALLLLPFAKAGFMAWMWAKNALDR